MHDRAWLVRHAIVLVLALAASCTSGPESKPRVDVNGRSIVIESPMWRVSDAIGAIGVTPREGMFLSAVTARPLAPNGNPANIQVDGKPAPLTAKVKPDSRITASSGADTVEPLDERLAYGDPPPLPPVITTLWRPGRGPGERQTVGRLSGEVVSRVAFGPPVPPEPQQGKVVGLTFDDGPDPKYTPAVLAILAEEAIPATFCVVGSAVKRYPDLVRAILAAGHTLCNHTMDHAHLPRLSRDKMVAQIVETSRIVAETVGQAPTVFRAPYGELSPEIIQTVHDNNMDVLGWSVDPSDFRRPESSVIAARILAAVKPGGVVLMHDGGGERDKTVGALRPLIRTLKAQGWSFSTPTKEEPVSPPP